MTDPALSKIVAAAARQFDEDLRRALPETALRIAIWLKRIPLASDGAIAALAPRSFPTLAIPYWIAPEPERTRDVDFQKGIAYSSLNGYYFIRLVDNVADNDGPVELRKLLPSAAYFLSAFQTPYRKFFEFDHPFWNDCNASWAEHSEATSRDSFLSDITYDDFSTIASRKFSASKVPILAAAYRYDKADTIPAWRELIDALGAFYQMVNDVFDWRRDQEYQIETFFISEWRRRRARNEPMVAWFVREGFERGRDFVRAAAAKATEAATELNCGPLTRWIAERLEIAEQAFARNEKGLDALQRIADTVNKSTKTNG